MNDPAAHVTLLCLDVDGVMTDGSIHIDDLGVETKRFHVRDGTGIRAWMALGNDVAILTGRRGMAVRHRAAELGIIHLIQGSEDKRGDFQRLITELRLQPGQAANYPHTGEDSVTLEDRFPPETMTALRQKGHPVVTVGALDGPCSVEAIRILGNGVRMAGSDPRRDGWALAW